MQENKLPTIGDIVRIFWYKRHLVWFNLCSFLLMAILLAFVMPRNYISSFKLFPPLATSKLPGSELWAALIVSAQQRGLYIGGNPSDLVKEIILSRSVGYAVIDSLNLVQRFKCKNREEAFEILQKMIRTIPREGNILEVAVSSTDPRLSYEIAQRVLDETYKVLERSLSNIGHKVLEDLGDKVKEVELKLHVLEDSMLQFQAKYKILNPSVETQQLLNELADLKAEYLSTLIELEMLKKYAATSGASIEELHARMDVLHDRIKEIEHKGLGEFWGPGFSVSISEIPKVSLQYLQLDLETRVYRNLYKIIRESYERARFYVEQKATLLEVLDPPYLPVKGKPRRLLIIVVTFVIGVIVTIVVTICGYYIDEVISRNREQLLDIVSRTRFMRWLTS